MVLLKAWHHENHENLIEHKKDYNCFMNEIRLKKQNKYNSSININYIFVKNTDQFIK